MIKSTGIALINFADAIKELKPSLVVLLGDRYEILSAAIASYFLKIPIAHIHGGESTAGAIDEGIRHSITKMSWLHFVATENYKRRVIQLGEDPKRVFNVGSLGIEKINNCKLINKTKLENILDIKFKKKNLLVTFHPETLDHMNSSNSLKEILNSLAMLNDTLIIFTYPNADAGNIEIKKLIRKFLSNHPNNTRLFSSLGSLIFLSILKIVDGIIGNSSSGIIEAPSLNTGTINIGNRQQGRDMAESIINCKPMKNEIIKSLNLLFSKKYVNSLNSVINPYEKNYTIKKILNKVKNINLPKNLNKKFFNL
jgi:UDP-hydrolysing UDP-N-acetyl-D-glucosamine 2-epimerase